MIDESAQPQQSSDARDGLRRSLVFLVRGWWLITIASLLGGLAALTYSFLQTPVYESSATLYVTSGSEDTAQTAYQGSLASQQRVASYSKLITSDVVLNRALESGNVSLSPDTARDALSARATPDTVLLTVIARSASPDVASRLANEVAASLTAYVAELERPSAGGTPLAKATVVSAAEPGKKPVEPRTKRLLAVGLLAGFVLGTASVYLWSRFSSRVRTAADVEDALGCIVLSEVPADSTLHERVPIDFSAGSTGLAEAYRRLRANLAFVGVDRSVRVLLVTSARAGEGKTTTCINLAAALADAGHGVVLVEADLRRPVLGQRLSLSSSIGLTEVLAGHVEVGEACQRTPRGEFDVMCGGLIPPNPSELLGSDRAKDGLGTLSATYDYVIVDSPPILPVADAIVLSHWVDAVMVVARADQTKIRELQAVATDLRTARVSEVSAVINCVAPRNAQYSYGYYSSDGGAALEGRSEVARLGGGAT